MTAQVPSASTTDDSGCRIIHLVEQFLLNPARYLAKVPTLDLVRPEGECRLLWCVNDDIDKTVRQDLLCFLSRLRKCFRIVDVPDVEDREPEADVIIVEYSSFPSSSDDEAEDDADGFPPSATSSKQLCAPPQAPALQPGPSLGRRRRGKSGQPRSFSPADALILSQRYPASKQPVAGVQTAEASACPEVTIHLCHRYFFPAFGCTS